MPRWGMIIDLRKCVGCGVCVEVCEQFNRVPPGVKWRKLIEHEIKGNLNHQHIYLTINCMHCNPANCLDVCPTKATYRRDDGIVNINLNLCLGCGACITACPYQSRTIAMQDIIPPLSETNENPVDYNRIGLCTKCDFCCERLDTGIAKGLEPGIDTGATPTCACYCIANAIYFGDFDDPASEVCKVFRDNKTVCLSKELDVDVSVHYILED